MSERVPAQAKNSATPSQATQSSSSLFKQCPFTDEIYESFGNDSKISKDGEGIQPKTTRNGFNWRNIAIEAPSRSDGMSLPASIQRQQEQQEETPEIQRQVSADSEEKSALESSNSTISTDGQAQQPKIARAGFNWRNISVEAPSRSGGDASPQPIQRQQQEAPEIQSQETESLEEKSAEKLSNSTISTDGRSQQPKIARASFNWRNISIEAPPSSAASSTYPGGIQRQETSDEKEEEESNESAQMQSEGAIQTKCSECEQEEKEKQNNESIQTKLTVGAPGDKYEQEADSMAAKVMTMPDSAIKQPIQRQTEEETEAVQRQPLVNSITPLVQRSSGEEEEIQMKSGVQRASDGSSQASASVENRLASSKGGGSALPDDVRSFMEPRFGADFSSIKVHTDSNAVQMNKELGAQAFAHGSDIYYGAGKSPGKNELTAHELTHTVQQGGAVRMNKEVQRQPQQEEEEKLQAKEIHTSQEEKLKQATPLNKESSFFRSETQGETIAAKEIPSYNPNLSQNKELRQKPQEEEQEETLDEPIQAKQFTNSSPFNNKNRIQRQRLAVSSVSPRIQGDFLGIGNPMDKIKGAIASFAKQLPGYPLLTLILGKDPISDAPVQRNATNLVRGLLSLVPNGDNIFNNLQQSGALQKAFDWFNGEVAKLNLTWDAIKGLFGKAINSLGIGDALNPMGAFEKVKNVFIEPIGRIKNFAVAAGTKVMEFAFEGFLNRAGGAGAKVMGILRKAGGVFTSILKDPVGFCGNLVGAVRGGFQKFSGNVATHLKNGLTGWLFGALAGAGLTLPAQFDLKGIVSIVLQVLGATYERLRGKLANKIGEQKVARLEKAFDFLRTIVTGGLAAAWQKISEFAGNLQEMVMGGIKEWVMHSVITAAVTKLISMFNPAGAIIQAVMAIYNTVMFFIERGSQIAALAEAVFNSIGNIAAGNVAGAANYVEQTMGCSLPVMISFLARLIGLGGVSEHIKNVIKKIQAPIENAMNKLANFIVEKGKSLLGKGDKGKAEKGNTQGPEKDENKGKPGDKGDEIEVPKALAASRTVQIDQPQERLIQEAAKTPSGTVIYQASVQEPKQATQKLLKEHPNAKYNDKTDVLTLPSLQEAPLEAAGSLKAIGTAVAQQTGLTQVVFNRNETGWSLDGKLNPTIAGLATHTGVPPSLDPLIQEIKTHETTINPSVEFFMSICREAAKRHGASVNFQQKFDNSVKPYRRYTEVTFSKATASGAMETFVTEIVSVSDNICPACEVDPGFTRPHHVIPASMWRDVIENALTTFGVTPTISDRYIGNIVAAGTSTKGPAVTEDKQCRKCEDNQDKPPGPYSLLQRHAGKLAGKATTISHPSAKTGTSGGDLFTGLQFKNASSAQIEQFTEDKIDQVVKRIEEVMATVPAGHAIQTNITSNPSRQTAFLNQIRTDALAKAKATPAAYPP